MSVMIDDFYPEFSLTEIVDFRLTEIGKGKSSLSVVINFYNAIEEDIIVDTIRRRLFVERLLERSKTWNEDYGYAS